MKVEQLLKKYIKDDRKIKSFMKEAIKHNLMFEECSGPLMNDKKYLNDRHCTMCGKSLDYWDIYRNFSINKYIGYGSAYDMSAFRATLCCSCFDKLMDTILPLFKYKFPLTPCLLESEDSKDIDKEYEEELQNLKRNALERIAKNKLEHSDISFREFIYRAEVILVDDAFKFDINKWEDEVEKEVSEAFNESSEVIKSSPRIIKYKFDDERINSVIEKIKHSDFSFIDYWDYKQFLKQNSLVKEDITKALKHLEIESYKAISKLTENDEVNEIVLNLKVSKIKDFKLAKINIKLDYDCVEEAPVIIISLHSNANGRDINRISTVLKEIEKAWNKDSDMRLCQLIINATGKDPYCLEDDELIRRINNIYKDKSTLYSGVFWIVNNLTDLSNDDYLFKIKTKPNGEIDSYDLCYKLNAKSEKTYNHQKLWDELPSKLRNGKDFDYYPRGRVMIANNKATVYYNPNLNSEEFKNYIIDRFNLTKENGINKIRFICDCSKHYRCHLDK